MQQVGIRALKERTSQIMRSVRESGEMFEITYHGRVIARLVPAEQSESELQLEEFWREWDRLSEEIGTRWPKGVSAVQAVREDRGPL